jgi:hypothetical protein
MNVRNIIITIVFILVVYSLYSYLYGGISNSSKLIHMHDARQSDIVSPSVLPTNTSTDYTYSVWFFISDWNYRLGEPKVIFGRTDKNNDPSPSVFLAPSINNIHISMAVYPSASTTNSAAHIHTCVLENVPLQKWSNLTISLEGRAMDVYLDGKLVRTCMMPGVPKADPASNILVTPDGGFNGQVAALKYIGRAINPTEAYNIYKDGYGSGSGIGSLGDVFNKYRIKMAFMENNREVNSLEL